MRQLRGALTQIHAGRAQGKGYEIGFTDTGKRGRKLAAALYRHRDPSQIGDRACNTSADIDGENEDHRQGAAPANEEKQSAANGPIERLPWNINGHHPSGELHVAGGLVSRVGIAPRV